MSIAELISFNEKLQNREFKVGPGQDENISPAASVGDFGWQGDLKITILDGIPDNYIRVKNPTEKHKQLVPGNTKGAKHCLNSLEGVEIWIPENWNFDESYDENIGPAVKFTKPNSLNHVEHGNVGIPEGMCLGFSYQKRLDRETQKIKRQID